MAKSLRNHLSSDLQSSVSLMQPANLDQASPISCSVNHLPSLFWSLCLWQYLRRQPFSLFEVLRLHRTYFVLTVLTDIISFLQLGISVEELGKTERRRKKIPNIWEMPFYLLRTHAAQKMRLSFAFSCSHVTACGASPTSGTYILCRSRYSKI